MRPRMPDEERGAWDMHSRILQVTKKDPTREEVDVIDESRYYDWPECDYTDQIDEAHIPGQLRDWMAGRPGMDVDADGRTVRIASVDEALRPYYDDWIAKLRECAAIGFGEYRHPYGYIPAWYRAKAAFAETGGLWFDDYDEEHGLMTIQDFLRASADGDVWHVVAMFDYHY